MPEALLAPICVKQYVPCKAVITFLVPLMRKLRDSQVFAQGQKPVGDRQAGAWTHVCKLQNPSSFHDFTVPSALWDKTQSVSYFLICEKIFQGSWNNLRLFTTPQSFVKYTFSMLSLSFFLSFFFLTWHRGRPWYPPGAVDQCSRPWRTLTI